MAEEDKGFIETIPAEFRETSWARENSESPETFFKFVNNQNALVGAKGVIVPGEDAKEDVINKFQMDLGRPEKSEGYTLANIEALKDVKRDTESDKTVQDILFKHGVSRAAGEGIVADYESFLHGKSEINKAEIKKQDDAFLEFNTKLFGDKRETIVANAQKILKETLPSEALPALDKLDSETLSLVIAATHGVFKKYGKEDDFTGSEGGAKTTGETYEELSAKQRIVMAQEGFADWRHKEHKKLQAQNDEIMGKMRLVQPKKV